MPEIKLSAKCQKRIKREIAKTRFFQTAEYVGEYKGYLVFAFSFLNIEDAGMYGDPVYLLVKDPLVRRPTCEEVRELWKIFY